MNRLIRTLSLTAAAMATAVVLTACQGDGGTTASKPAKRAASAPPETEERSLDEKFEDSVNEAEKNRAKLREQIREAAEVDGMVILPRTWGEMALPEAMADAKYAGFTRITTFDITSQHRDVSNPYEWKVCMTDPEPDEYPIGTPLQFGVTKIGELCV